MQVLAHFDPAVVVDFTTAYGVDLHAVWQSRSWRWFESHVIGLLSRHDSMLRAALMDDEKDDKGA